jgi:hypothetical protein
LDGKTRFVLNVEVARPCWTRPDGSPTQLSRDVSAHEILARARYDRAIRMEVRWWRH